jgi:DNA repair protein RecN (Recombination protein N)
LCSAAGAGAEALESDSADGSGVASLLAGAGAQLEAVTDVDPRLDGLAVRLRAVAIEAGDLAGELRMYAEQGEPGEIAGEAQTLDGIEARLAALERLMRKHGGDIEGVLEHAATARARHEEIAGAEVALEQQRAVLAEARERLNEHARMLHEAREQAVPLLERGVCEQLSSLAMADAMFAVQLSEREPGPSGADDVEFTIAPNRGVPAGPLRDIASGGELSRVMLALVTASDGVAAPARRGSKGASAKSARARRDAAQPAETFVFDEIDAGIGGHAARAVGARLRELGAKRQVICITHLPQIASLGERHFSIVKESSDELARTSVVQLAEREVVAELVRMLGADAEDTAARRHAQDLRRAA